MMSVSHLCSPISPMPAPDLIETIGGVDIFRYADGSIRYTSGLQIDADGSPRAYAPAGSGLTGLDYLANAGRPGNWWGIVTDKDGHPYIQDRGDPAPGYYVSATTLQHPGFHESDPARYVDSEKIPFIVLPPQARQKWGVKLGAAALVRNSENGRECEAIFADVGPRNKIGEGSIALAEKLGIPSDPKRGGTDRRVIEYRILPV